MICRSLFCHKILKQSTRVRLYSTVLDKTKAPQITTIRIDLNNLKKSISDNLISSNNDEVTKFLQKEDNDKTLLPPSLRQVRTIMDVHKNNVVLTQMGSFYELYFEHATQYAPKLNISLTSKKYSSGKVPFAGFPLSQLNRHLKVLVNQLGYSVTIVDQFQNHTPIDNDPNKFFRKVSRIVTPGTFIDEAFENFRENSYLLNIEFPSNCMNKLADSNTKIGLCWCDLSTGEIFVQEVQLKDLISAITRIKPKEIILNSKLLEFNIENGEWYPELVELKKYFVKFQTLPAQYHTVDTFYNLFFSGNNDFIRRQLDHKLRSFTQKEIASLRNILEYVQDHLPDCSVNFQLPERQSTTRIMQIDSRTNSALELHSTIMNNGKRGSLLSTIRRTVTPSGTRLLTNWLSAPSLDLSEITERQTFVGLFKRNFSFNNTLISQLREVNDLSRILQKFSFGKGTAIDLIQISKSLKTAFGISKMMIALMPTLRKKEQILLQKLIDQLTFDTTLIDNILESINEDKVISQEKSPDTGEDVESQNTDKSISNSESKRDILDTIIPSGYSPLLQRYHDEYFLNLKKKDTFENICSEFLINTFGIRKATLKQRQNNSFALLVNGSPTSLVKLDNWVNENNEFMDATFHTLQKSNQTRWLSHSELTDRASRIELSLLKIKKEEDNVLNSFKTQLLERCNEIRIINSTLAYIDTLSSFAKLAEEKNLICPKVDNSLELKINKGRHLMVEEGITSKSLQRFVSNDCNLDQGDIWVITGPNMGGKSTFLRQNAIIVILAQIGSYVPCDSAHIGLVDKIFSRVGSADDLYNELSTFMVEMIETSFILHGATNRSLAILDEIGRGTSGKEGISIAYAAMNFMAEQNQCRTLFATHFGEELNNLIQKRPGTTLSKKVKFFQSKMIEIDRIKFYYDYRMVPGICTKSDAIRVARSAGFPESVLEEAEQILTAGKDGN
ncbi:similar to Saccharomyces cerevisiae YHR120W MSH1 DNA-binding protein of the mitochondria involved in repair of mitochondrial DNA, has ATPase activity and binds to DNA mismatches [Maudiozyma saulgeensis]|uniref:Similar to Saccharomyces cerevisiae YHR120W MSH1 DNA-binding protein of the mitochondria involved in repair of mitochondrial DNA, has ATPase activity and binds to DNA mismatches n=1 Tax=Maudiozyma saulgeensis TaxID=1789683 RepID=A0A1X7QZR2_9SACH|nr:similar to Saccharomyces cerevisiae YHR120W MSH1 DNA-binding protein of the mitochondria involved in repair of mitochondrial DNA, has ATPase activity and binds to DNA mismatches [Kazachstania saulgeensis]